MTYVDTGLYIGTVDDAYDRPQLEKKGITHILTVETKPLQQQATDGKVQFTALPFLPTILPAQFMYLYM